MKTFQSLGLLSLTALPSLLVYGHVVRQDNSSNKYEVYQSGRSPAVYPSRKFYHVSISILLVELIVPKPMQLALEIGLKLTPKH